MEFPEFTFVELLIDKLGNGPQGLDQESLGFQWMVKSLLEDQSEG